MKLTVFFNLIVFILFFYCCKTNSFNNSEGIGVSILNDTIKIPKYDNIDCVDTIYLKFTNRSKYNYFFLFNFVDVWFVSSIGMYPYGKSTPVVGININFRYKRDFQKLEACIAMGYNPDVSQEQIDREEQLVKIKAGNEVIIKSILKFPSHPGFGEETQIVENLRFAELAEIIFEPDSFLTSLYLKEKNIGLKSNDKFLKIRKEFLLPVLIKCE